ncbi:MerR family transcriptional regulator [Novosphingobium sp. KCTC 2891]|uniref:MerR family transcriptional regulator n=1 Tax=Novosphingobium sp. KCTC 2891 TaxID=2989730 RepID=UPI002221C3EB|nr:MerR family transcriptional regulator [Novosphingobium sp. KCTC 2891]MCW1381454.1 MerR family transcriptional regulator [Novosphingobium sp. KCTC 2891]
MAQAPLPDFQDGKDPEALRTIGEVAKALDLKQHVLRYWEEQFPMLRPLTRAGGRRYYRPEDVALVAQINRLLHQEGYTIRGARQALQGKRAPKAAAAVNAVETPAPAATPASLPVALSHGEGEDAVVEALRILAGHLIAVRERLAEAISD